MKRRQYLERIGAASSLGIVALAGCGAPGDGAAGTPDATETTTATETAAGTGTGPPTETPTEERTGSPANGTTDRGQTETSTGGPPNEIAMLTEGSNYLFDPVGLSVEPGETITWVNESDAHSTTAYTQDNPQSNVNRVPDDAEGWDSGILSESGAEFTHTFDVAGTYDYYCIPHKTLGMVGRLVVGEPSGVEGDPPDGPVPAEDRIVEQGVVPWEDFDP